MKRLLTLTALLCALAGPLAAQVPVAQAPPIKFQFFSNAGLPLAAGCLTTFQAGTSNLAATYTESTGTSLNSNPIILDAAGRADIWLPNAAFKFTMKSAGGVNCASGSTLWTVDGITGVLGLLNLNNIWTGTNTFNQPIVIAVNANQIVAGLPGAQTTLNFPAPAGNITLNTPSVAGTLARTSGDTFTSPILNNPNFNGTVVTGPPATYLVMANDLVTGTTLNKLAKINPAGLAGFAILPSPADTFGTVGIVVSGAGTAGNATIQQNGSASCVFDNAVTSGDYVQLSTTGGCHDAGATYPTSGQVQGRLLATNASPGTYLVDLFGPEIRSPSATPIDLTNQQANIAATTILTPSANGFYRFDCYVVIAQAATTSSTLPTCAVGFTDVDSNVAQTFGVTATSTANVLGTAGQIPTSNILPWWFYAKSGVAIKYSTSGYTSVGGTPMAYGLHIRLTGPF